MGPSPQGTLRRGYTIGAGLDIVPRLLRTYHERSPEAAVETTRDAIDPPARPETEVKQRYKLLIARVALRTLHEIFSATPSEVVEAVVFNGRVSTIDRATGKPARPHLVSVSAERSVLQDLVLAAVEPAACLVRLNALVSPNPFDMEAVEPFIEFDLRRFRFMDDLDVVSGLDGRKNLLKLTPTEFEHLVKDLFVAMGAEAWNTFPSKDGGGRHPWHDSAPKASPFGQHTDRTARPESVAMG
jgi:restriction system protein